MPKISIIVPVYKAEKYITDCILSLQRQSIKDIEIILVDDCGGDNSIFIVEKLAKFDKRIKIIYHQENLGPMMARYDGVLKSEGDYITFCDSDDTLPHDALEKLLNKAIISGADIVSGTIDYITNSNKHLYWNNSLKYGGDKISVYKSLLLGEYGHNLCGKLFRSSILRNNKYSHFPHFINGEDAIFFYEIVHNINIATTIKDIVYYYQQNDNSSSQTRLTNERLKNVVIANALNYKKCIEFIELKKLANSYFSICLNNWYIGGYNKYGYLDKLVCKYNVKHLVTPRFMLLNLPFWVFFKTMVKRILSNIKNV